MRVPRMGRMLHTPQVGNLWESLSEAMMSWFGYVCRLMNVEDVAIKPEDNWGLRKGMYVFGVTEEDGEELNTL